ncbi:MAG: HAMP domain-containing sensor histidine kinase [Pseudomonadota bacterium]
MSDVPSEDAAMHDAAVQDVSMADGAGGMHASLCAFLDSLFARGLVGVAFADEDFIVRDTHGALVSWMSAGTCLTQDVAPFIGLEDALFALRDEHRPPLVLANVGLPQVDGLDGKCSLQVFWSTEINAAGTTNGLASVEGDQGAYAVIVHRLGAQPEFEADLARQVRGRRLAEEKISALTRDLGRSQDMLTTLADRAPVALAIEDRDGARMFASRLWVQWFGDASSDMLIADAERSVIEEDDGDRAPLPRGTTVLHRRDVGPRGEVDYGRPALPRVALARSPDVGAVAHGDGRSVSAAADVDGWLSALEAAHAERSHLCRLASDLDAYTRLIAHDLRSPLAEASHVLLGGGDTSAAQQAIARGLSLVETLLEYAHTGLRAGPTGEVDLAALADAVGREASSGTCIRVERLGEWPTAAVALAPFDTVLRNLVGNAVRHHDRAVGRVELRCAHEAAGWLRIEVTDDGPGIARARHATLFADRLDRGQGDQGGEGDQRGEGDQGGEGDQDGEANQNGEGSAVPAERSTGGLGLGFVRRMLDAVGGSIVLESNPPEVRGSRFVVRWPIAR